MNAVIKMQLVDGSIATASAPAIQQCNALVFGLYAIQGFSMNYFDNHVVISPRYSKHWKDFFQYSETIHVIPDICQPFKGTGIIASVPALQKGIFDRWWSAISGRA